MKKILGVLSAVILALTLASCSKAESNSVKIGRYIFQEIFIIRVDFFKNIRYTYIRDW